ncbi:MAG TPA: hypothetical protein VFW92_00490 [Candidatus Limnocylindrales bacterium]|nr:hypothetical protein [Candidatus Limnocylindrales bacterium]
MTDPTHEPPARRAPDAPHARGAEAPEDPLEPELRRWFASHDAPPAPASLRRALDRLPIEHPAVERVRPAVGAAGGKSSAARTVRFLAVAAALTLLAVASGVLLFAGRPRPGPATPTPAGTPTATPASSASSGLSEATPTPSGTRVPTGTPLPVLPGFTTPAPLADDAAWTGLRWTKLDPDDPLGLVRQVLSWSGGYLALGSTTFTSGQTVTPLWRSTDGQHWITIPPAALGQQPFVLAIGRAGPNLVVLTSGGDDRDCGPDDASGAFCMEPAGAVSSWTSADGAAWTWHAGPAGPPDEVPTNVASGPSGMVFADRAGSGSADTKFATPAPDASTVAVTADGTLWRLVDASLLPAGVQMNAVIGTPSGYVAVGAMTTGPDLDAAVALRSTDGERWQTTQLPMPTAKGSGIVEAATGASWLANSIVAGSHGFIAQGVVAAAPGAELWWRSPDGRTWEPLSGYPPLGPTSCEGEGCGGGADGSLAGDGTRIVAFRGLVPSGEPDVKPGDWVSTDGLHWRSLSMTGPIGQVSPSVLPFGLISDLNDVDGKREVWFGQALTSEGSGATPTSTPPDGTTLPIDPTITPVSRSHPGSVAQEVLDACHVDQIGLDRVAGMGLIAHASDAFHYAPFTGQEPELRGSEPVWLVVFSGQIPMPMEWETWIDPTCVDASGEAGFFATGAVIETSTGQELPAPAVSQPPDRALPPLAP